MMASFLLVFMFLCFLFIVASVGLLALKWHRRLYKNKNSSKLLSGVSLVLTALAGIVFIVGIGYPISAYFYNATHCSKIVNKETNSLKQLDDELTINFNAYNRIKMDTTRLDSLKKMNRNKLRTDSFENKLKIDRLQMDSLNRRICHLQSILSD